MRALRLIYFDISYQLKRHTTWIYFIAVFLLVLLVIDEIVDYAQTIGGIQISAPITIASVAGFVCKFGLLLMAAVVGEGAIRDLQQRMDSLVFTTSTSKNDYLLSRYLSLTFIIGFLLMLLLILPLCIGGALLIKDQNIYSSLDIQAYLDAFTMIILPNAVIISSIIFCAVIFFRNSIAAFPAAVLILIIHSLATSFGYEAAEVIDPLGLAIVDNIQARLNPMEYNQAYLPFNYSFMINRLLWALISTGLLVITFRTFKFSGATTLKLWSWRKKPLNNEETLDNQFSIEPINYLPRFNLLTRLQQLKSLSITYFKEIVLSRQLLIFAFVFFFSMFILAFLGKGPMQYPVNFNTFRVITILNAPVIYLLKTLLLLYFAGQLVWRERDHRLDEIADAVPLSGRLIMSGKLLTLLYLALTIQGVLFVAGLMLQFLKTATSIDLILYLKELFLYDLPVLLVIAIVLLAAHAIVLNKFIGHLLGVFIVLFTISPDWIGIEHTLLIFNSAPDIQSSPFYNRDYYFLDWLIYRVYWCGWGLLIFIITYQIWPRGRSNSIISRFNRFSLNRNEWTLLAAALIVTTVAGGSIFYHTNIKHPYVSSDEKIERQVAYERSFRKYQTISQPDLINIDLDVSLFPEESNATLKGTYTMINQSSEAIDSIHLSMPEDLRPFDIQFDKGFSTLLADDRLHYHIYKLKVPLEKGDSLKMNFVIQFDGSGFDNSGFYTEVSKNSVWIQSFEWLPHLGYQRDRQVFNKGLREEHELVEEDYFLQLSKKTDVRYILEDPFVAVNSRISTSSGHTAVAPGTLRKEWREGERRYFEFRTEKPIRNDFFILSADYNKAEDTFGGTSIALYHLPQDTLNADIMVMAMEASLQYFKDHLSAYPYKTLKMVETPDPGIGGISLPTMIGFSSNFANLDAHDQSYNLPFAVTAHEVAHQWWGNQLVPAPVEGAFLLSESLAWFSAFGIVEEFYGKDHLNKLLNSMRKDILNPRSKADLPLIRANSKFHGYRKGALAMFALREYIGEQRVNQGLTQLLKKVNTDPGKLTTSWDLYNAIEDHTPDSLQYLLKDLFLENTYWNLRIAEAKISEIASQYSLTVSIDASKVYVDTQGVESPVEMDDWVEIGVYNKEDKLIYKNWYKLQSGRNEIILRMSERPLKVGVDPLNLLIDAEPENNLFSIY